MHCPTNRVLMQSGKTLLFRWLEVSDLVVWTERVRALAKHASFSKILKRFCRLAQLENFGVTPNRKVFIGVV